MNHEAEREDPVESTLPAEDETRAAGGMSRRDALAIIGKYSIYTAPAVTAILTLTKSNKAVAGSGDGDDDEHHHHHHHDH